MFELLKVENGKPVYRQVVVRGLAQEQVKAFHKAFQEHGNEWTALCTKWSMDATKDGIVATVEFVETVEPTGDEIEKQIREVFQVKACSRTDSAQH
jgi:hypothetical protein